MSERPQPLKAINRLFENKEPWQIITMTASSVLALVWAHSLYNHREGPTTRLRKEFFRWLRHVPMVRRKIEEKMDEIKAGFQKDLSKRLAGVTCRRKLPEIGLSPQQIAEEVKDHMNLGAYDWQSGSLSGAVYHVDQEIARVACEAYALTAYSNPLHADVFPGINKMEAEIVRFAIELFHGDDECCGTMTTGGTESIIMACKAFRDYAYEKGITNPQIIVPSTVHSAFDKAAQYLGLSVKTIPVKPDTMTVDVNAVRRAISRRTCLIVGSAPNFPYGTMDDINALSDLALEYDIPLHVDACLGGFVAAFMPQAGHPVPVFDFRLPGVASISADTHKVYNYRIDLFIISCLGGFVAAFMPQAGHPVPVFDFRLPGVASISADTHKVTSLSIELSYSYIPLHVDACLGGFVAAFMPQAGHPVPVFDFRLPGVASISADTHKSIELSYSSIPLHVDACLGGFVAAFMPQAGHPVPVFDFRLPGVASISADTHKVTPLSIELSCCSRVQTLH
ncbi:pyridoxal-dependent decarboxylase conserved domain-containing protein [Phthorimaea operculella]|nr:pyridoxal-dependent decarboxylase conserved domain-containing protein [Phthorimaea operculella]